MIRISKSKGKTLVGLAATGVAVVLFFQNCADPLNVGENSSLSNLPFAYDATVDTLSYMSCAGGPTSSNADAIWTFRAGAYSAASGLALTPGYAAATSNYSPGQRAAALAETPVNQNAFLQLSIRNVLNYQSPLLGTGSPRFGQDFSTVLGPLDQTAIATALANVDQASLPRLNYFPGTGKVMQGTIRYVDNETVAQSVRQSLANEGILTLTYAGEESETVARRPSSNVTTAYGRGYRLGFVAAAAGETETRVLSSIDEINLETNHATGIEIRPWVCPSAYRFRIATSCSTCGCPTDNPNDGTVAVMRRVLRPEHWWIDPGARCVVQKQVSQQCYPVGVGTYNFVSVCLRQ